MASTLRACAGVPNRFSTTTLALRPSGLTQPSLRLCDSVVRTRSVSGMNSRICTVLLPIMVRESPSPIRYSVACQVPLGALSGGVWLKAL